jgi:hypothetical protein
MQAASQGLARAGCVQLHASRLPFAVPPERAPYALEGFF